MTQINLLRNRAKETRMLEIGPGPARIPDFETLNVIGDVHVDYIADASRQLPFNDGTFDIVYASHILEHVPWYQVSGALAEWVRILKVGGHLELWVPDGLKICKGFVDAEMGGATSWTDDGWYRFNDDRDPCKWAAGRLFTYGDGRGTVNHPNWHRALFSRRYLRECLRVAGLHDIRDMDRAEVRGYDHEWINLGMRGTKPPANGSKG